MKNQTTLKLRSHILLGWLVLVILTFGISQAEGIVTLGFSPKEFIDPIPNLGDKIDVNITLRDFDGTQGAGDIATVEFYVDYDLLLLASPDPAKSLHANCTRNRPTRP